jgi:hypothetical protein
MCYFDVEFTFTKPGTNRKKLRSGDQNWNKLKILKSDRIIEIAVLFTEEPIDRKIRIERGVADQT